MPCVHVRSNISDDSSCVWGELNPVKALVSPSAIKESKSLRLFSLQLLVCGEKVDTVGDDECNTNTEDESLSTAIASSLLNRGCTGISRFNLELEPDPESFLFFSSVFEVEIEVEGDNNLS